MQGSPHPLGHPRTASAAACMVAALILQGCQAPAGTGTPPHARPALQAHAWQCDDGTRLVTRNRPAAIELHIGTAITTLPRMPAASGARYAGAGISFWSKGSSATLERSPAAAIACNEIRTQSLPEDARVRGLGFRGTGNEPGWLLEIGPGNSALFEDRYGSVRLTFADLQQHGATTAGTTVYSGESGRHRLRVVLKRQTCADSMSGDVFPAMVEVEIDGERRSGCGTPLR